MDVGESSVLSPKLIEDLNRGEVRAFARYCRFHAARATPRAKFTGGIVHGRLGTPAAQSCSGEPACFDFVHCFLSLTSPLIILLVGHAGGLQRCGGDHSGRLCWHAATLPA